MAESLFVRADEVIRLLGVSKSEAYRIIKRLNDEMASKGYTEKGQSYSAKEQELIRQLIQARLEQQSELGYEDLEGYELPPRTQFSMLNKPAVTFKHRQMTFNAASVRLFEGVRYILPFTSKSKKRVAVVTCKEEESESVEWARRNKKGVWVSKTITSDEYVSKIFKFMGWDQTCRYKVMGRVSNSERGLTKMYPLHIKPTPIM